MDIQLSSEIAIRLYHILLYIKETNVEKFRNFVITEFVREESTVTGNGE